MDVCHCMTWFSFLKGGIRWNILSLTSPLCYGNPWKRIDPTILLFAELVLRVKQHLKGSAAQQVRGWSCHSCFPFPIYLCLELSTNDEIILLWSHPTDTAKITFHSFCRKPTECKTRKGISVRVSGMPDTICRCYSVSYLRGEGQQGGQENCSLAVLCVLELSGYCQYFCWYWKQPSHKQQVETMHFM